MKEILFVYVEGKQVREALEAVVERMEDRAVNFIFDTPKGDYHMLVMPAVKEDAK